MDVIAPFGNAQKLLKQLQDSEFKGKDVNMIMAGQEQNNQDGEKKDKEQGLTHMLLADFLEKVQDKEK